MSSSRTLFAGCSFVALALAVGCAAPVDTNPGSEGQGGTAREAYSTPPSCGFDYELQSSDEGPGGSTIYWCQQVAPTGTNASACSGAYSIPSSLVGQGCTKGTAMNLQSGTQCMSASPTFVCPAGMTVPKRLGVVGTSLPLCLLDANGIPIPTDKGCVSVGAFQAVSNSCVGPAPSDASAPIGAWEFVSEAVFVTTNKAIGGSCGGSCATVGGGSKWTTGP